jgi:hypothetical protein
MLNKGPHIVTAMKTLLDINRRMQDHQQRKKSLLRRLQARTAIPSTPNGHHTGEVSSRLAAKAYPAAKVTLCSVSAS